MNTNHKIKQENSREMVVTNFMYLTHEKLILNVFLEKKLKQIAW